MHQPNEDDLHRWASDDLQDALLFGTPETVLVCLKRLDRLDGEPLKILVQQLEGSVPQKRFRNRFQLVRRPGKPPSIADEPAARGFIAACYLRFRKRGLARKKALFETAELWGIKTTTITGILAEAKQGSPDCGLGSA
jgi:hypothetical protein